MNHTVLHRIIALAVVATVTSMACAQESRIGIDPFDDYEQWKRALSPGKSTDPSSFQLLPGFELDLLRSAQADESSWLSIIFDPKGRAIIGREDRGLLRVTLPNTSNDKLQVESINDELRECRGLLYAFDSLYVASNGDRATYRLQDTNGDDQFDKITRLYETPGGRGHGRNGLALGSDNRIYAIHGDSVDLPRDCKDRTSPFREHRRGERSREGFVLRFDPDGSNREIFAAGLRNPYGLAFNPNGDLFTYDADAEYDMGSPWYRPTRILHLVSGADYGWRAVTKQWPPYYPDHPDLPTPVMDIGKGSPTGMVFGTVSHFPDKYRRALFALDWSYGRIIAVHLDPKGASYRGAAETFLRGQPANVTDVTFGPDGAMYFVTGGRKTQSGLYRVRYVGPRTHGSDSAATHDLAEQRRAMEQWHGVIDETVVNRAWPQLSHQNGSVRYAAMIAIEHQPLDQWRERALNDDNLITLMMLARALPVESALKQPVLKRLLKRSPGQLNPIDTSIAHWIIELCLNAPGEVPSRVRRDLIQWLEHPSAAPLPIRLLARLNATGVVSNALDRLTPTTPQSDHMHVMFQLRNVTAGWTEQLRTRYIAELKNMNAYRGGQGMPAFIKQIKADAVASVPNQDRESFANQIASKPIARFIAKPRPAVRNWSVQDLVNDLDKVDADRDLHRGERLFHEVMCAYCHRLRNHGRSFGPDLTNVQSRFSRQDILRSIIEPSAVVSEKYQSSIIRTSDGKTYIGSVVLSGDFRSPFVRLAINPSHLGEVIQIPKADILSREPSPVSFMPPGLLSTLQKDEILDLLAFLESAPK